MKAPRYQLITFGAGLPNWRAAAGRLASQARQTGWFEDVTVYTEADLASRFPHFVSRHRTILRPSVPGFGYWIWKPYLLWQGLLSARANGYDGVLYLDAGFEINYGSANATSRMTEYWDLAHDNQGIFAMHLTGHPERAWTRTSVLNALEVTPLMRDSPQIQATPFSLPTAFAIDLAELWYRKSVEDNYELVRDERLGDMNDAEFRAHRHDQSVFSCLLKRASIQTIPDETFWAPEWSTRGCDFPLWATRNRTRVSILDQSVPGRIVRMTEKAYSRAYMKLVAARSHLRS